MNSLVPVSHNSHGTKFVDSASRYRSEDRSPNPMEGLVELRDSVSGLSDDELTRLLWCHESSSEFDISFDQKVEWGELRPLILPPRELLESRAVYPISGSEISLLPIPERPSTTLSGDSFAEASKRCSRVCSSKRRAGDELVQSAPSKREHALLRCVGPLSLKRVRKAIEGILQFDVALSKQRELAKGLSGHTCTLLPRGSEAINLSIRARKGASPGLVLEFERGGVESSVAIRFCDRSVKASREADLPALHEAEKLLGMDLVESQLPETIYYKNREFKELLIRVGCEPSYPQRLAKLVELLGGNRIDFWFDLKDVEEPEQSPYLYGSLRKFIFDSQVLGMRPDLLGLPSDSEIYQLTLRDDSCSDPVALQLHFCLDAPLCELFMISKSRSLRGRELMEWVDLLQAALGCSLFLFDDSRIRLADSDDLGWNLPFWRALSSQKKTFYETVGFDSVNWPLEWSEGNGRGRLEHRLHQNVQLYKEASERVRQTSLGDILTSEFQQKSAPALISSIQKLWKEAFGSDLQAAYSLNVQQVADCLLAAVRSDSVIQSRKAHLLLEAMETLWFQSVTPSLKTDLSLINDQRFFIRPLNQEEDMGWISPWSLVKAATNQ